MIKSRGINVATFTKTRGMQVSFMTKTTGIPSYIFPLTSSILHLPSYIFHLTFSISHHTSYIYVKQVPVPYVFHVCVVVSKIYVSITPSLSNSSRKLFTEAAQNLS